MDNPVITNTPELWRDKLPKIAVDAHKYTRGYVIVVGGAIMTGAARLAARASARVGAGAAAIATIPETLAAYQQAEPHLIILPIANYAALSELLTDPRHQTFVIGPGFGRDHDDELKSFVIKALQGGRTLILDADGLNAFADIPEKLNVRPDQKLIITPHAGEFQTLFGFAPDDRIAAARHAAKTTNAVVVLKGHDTVIADANGQIVINKDAPETLATAGSGDVLSGIIAGLCAGGMSPFYAACAAVWIHAEAARSFGAGLVATDLPDCLPGVWHHLLS